MSEEEKKEMIELITPQKTDKDYEEEIERLHSIIKEAIELLESKKHCERLFGGVEEKTFTEQAIEILEKENK